MDNHTQEYYNAILNAPPYYPGVPYLTYNNPASHIVGQKQFDSTPIKIIPDVQESEIFLQITHSELLPNIMPGRYYVSNFGRIYDTYRLKYLPGTDNGYGYLNVKLTYIKDSGTLAYKTIYIHQIVNYYFNYLNTCLKQKLTCNHMDSNQINNRSDNLEWITQDENNYHKILSEQNRLIQEMKEDKDIHKTVSHSDITVDCARQICEMLSQGYSVAAIAGMLNVKSHTVQGIKYRSNWTWLSKDYEFTNASQDKYDFRKLHIPEDKVHQICKLISQDVNMDDIVKLTGMDRQVIAAIKYNGLYPAIRAKYGL